MGLFYIIYFRAFKIYQQDYINLLKLLYFFCIWKNLHTSNIHHLKIDVFFSDLQRNRILFPQEM